MENLVRDSLCEELAGDMAAGESMLTWLRSIDCFRERLGGLEGGGGVGDFRWPLDCCGLKILPEKAQLTHVMVLRRDASQNIFHYIHPWTILFNQKAVRSALKNALHDLQR